MVNDQAVLRSINEQFMRTNIFLIFFYIMISLPSLGEIIKEEDDDFMIRFYNDETYMSASFFKTEGIYIAMSRDPRRRKRIPPDILEPYSFKIFSILQIKYKQQLEEQNQLIDAECPVCLEEKPLQNLCSSKHGACKGCATLLQECPICRRPIEKLELN